MAKTVNSWTEYVARLEEQLRNGVDSTSFRHQQLTTPDGVTTVFRSFSDIRSELNLARAEAAKEEALSGGFSPFMAECAP